MIRIIFTIIILFTLATVAYASAVTSEVLAIHSEAKQAYLAGDFARLDQMIDDYQRSDARTDSGIEKVAEVYRALGNNQELFGTVNYESLGKANLLAERWVKERPNSRAARLMVVSTMISRAGYIRGDGYISTVTSEQYEGFVKEMNKAESYLLTYKATVGLDPEWYKLMLSINIWFVDQNSFKILADEALKKFPHYYPIQWVIVAKALPRWHGSVDWIIYWLNRFEESDSPEAYARAYWVVDDWMYPNTFVADWRRLKVGFEQMVDRYPSNWNLNKYAYFACISDDREKLTELFERIGTKIDPDAWMNKSAVAFCRERARTPPVKVAAPLEEWYLVEAYGRRESGAPLDLLLGPMDLPSEHDAVKRARELAPKYEGVQAYRLVPHPNKDEYQRPIVLFRSGTIPTRFEK